MKKNKLINTALSQLIAELGHTDSLVIADAGLPIALTTSRIDLALTKGVPTFLETLEVVLSEMYIEKAIIAEEMLTASSDIHGKLVALLDDTPIEVIEHTAFKRRTSDARAVVRTGEYTPYANVILIAGAWSFGL